MEQLAVRWDLQRRWKLRLDAPDTCLSPQTLLRKSDRFIAPPPPPPAERVCLHMCSFMLICADI